MERTLTIEIFVIVEYKSSIGFSKFNIVKTPTWRTIYIVLLNRYLRALVNQDDYFAITFYKFNMAETLWRTFYINTLELNIRVNADYQ